jgi:hypothetical protein
MRKNSPWTIEKDISGKLFFAIKNANLSPVNSNNVTYFLTIRQIFLSFRKEN